jgi:hypothetical protein
MPKGPYFCCTERPGSLVESFIIVLDDRHHCYHDVRYRENSVPQYQSQVRPDKGYFGVQVKIGKALGVV